MSGSKLDIVYLILITVQQLLDVFGFTPRQPQIEGPQKDRHVWRVVRTGDPEFDGVTRFATIPAIKAREIAEGQHLEVGSYVTVINRKFLFSSQRRKDGSVQLWGVYVDMKTGEVEELSQAQAIARFNVVPKATLTGRQVRQLRKKYEEEK